MKNNRSFFILAALASLNDKFLASHTTEVAMVRNEMEKVKCGLDPDTNFLRGLLLKCETSYQKLDTRLHQIKSPTPPASNNWFENIRNAVSLPMKLEVPDTASMEADLIEMSKFKDTIKLALAFWESQTDYEKVTTKKETS